TKQDDPAETAKWSLLLSGLRGAEAFLVRGFVWENGIHVTRDPSAAADNYRQAASRGDARGQLWLGLMQAEGKGKANDIAVPETKKDAVGAALEKSDVVRKP